jgi:ABC-2 type transport system permease protein
VNTDGTGAWTAAQERGQFAALAQLRWCLFRNSFRRKGGTGELVARILILPIIGAVAAGPVAGAGIAGYSIASSGRFELLPALTWAIFALWLLVSINLSPPALSFDINILLRFPISFPRYLIARLFFGLLSASSVIGTLALLSADIGIGIARHSLFLWATLLFAVFAAANILFTRMIFAWVDRWLSTRRARELLTAFVLFASLGFQYLNVTFNPGLQGSHHHANHLPVLLSAFHRLQPLAAFLPPGLTAASLAAFSQGHFGSSIAFLFALLAFAALFLAIYGWRMQREFRGENLNEVIPQRRAASTGAGPHGITSVPLRSAASGKGSGVSSTVAACLEKEFLYLRRNTNQLYGFLAPVFMVFLFAGRLGSSGALGSMVFPTAVAYSILGVSILSYNCLGMDGAGVQFYFLAPVQLRDIFLAKNSIGFLLNLIELLLIYFIISFVGHAPSPLMTTATVCWLLFVVFTNGAVGNLRSLTAPKKIDLSKISRKQTSQLSALLALGVVLACCGIGIGVLLLANYLHHPWLMVPMLLGLAALGFAFYWRVLHRLESIAAMHRESIAEELYKV